MKLRNVVIVASGMLIIARNIFPTLQGDVDAMRRKVQYEVMFLIPSFLLLQKSIGAVIIVLLRIRLTARFESPLDLNGRLRIMIRFGDSPYLECSSKGDKRFSAFYARIKRRRNQTIEELYQGMKMIDGCISGLSIKEAKGKKPINIEQCRSFYSLLWDEYFDENPNLLLEIGYQYKGFSDVFGQTGHACQAEEVYRIVNERLTPSENNH